MNKHVNYAWVGFFVVLFVSLIIMTSIWLSLVLGQEKYNHYTVYVKADVSGLSLASPVRFSGVEVGTVYKIAIDKHDLQAVVITIKVEVGTPVTTSTVATVQTEGITGVQYIALKSLRAKAPALLKKDGEKYPSIPFQPSLFMRVSNAVQLITVQIEHLSESVQEILSQKNMRAFSDSLANVQNITHNLAHDSKKIDKIIASTSTILQQTAQASKQFPLIVSHANDVLLHLTATAESVQKTAAKVSVVLSQASDVMDATTQQVVPEVTRFVGQLNQIGSNVSTLSSELKRNPAVIIRGKRPPALGPGEK